MAESSIVAEAAEAENAKGGAEAKITHSGKRYVLTLTWAKENSDGEDFRMILARSGPKETITNFIAEHLLKFPDADLVSEALSKCNEKLPEDIRLF
jgi:hypothetical protein